MNVMAPRPSRWLRLTSPHMEGEDVEALQRAVNDRLTARGKAKVLVDGDYGERTRDALRVVLWHLGCPADKLDAGGTTAHQRIVRDPDSRPEGWLQVARDRKLWLSKRSNGAKAFLDDLHSFYGKVENPRDFNRGTWLDPLLKAEGWLPPRANIKGPPYCAIGLMALYTRAGVDCGAWAYTPNWISAARSGTLGWKLVNPSARRPGDAFFIKIPGVSNDACDHVGAVDDPTSKTGEFNTSSGQSGSQNNGGGCYPRTWRERSSMVVAVARPPWPSA